MKYKLIDRTPEELRCTVVTCPAIYEVKELTPEELRCIVGSCPAIYEIENLTPKGMNCGPGFCPGIYGSEGNYVIIGTKVNPADFGLEKKVGENEALIQVPKKLIDKMKK